MEEETQSIFVEYFGSSPYIKVLDFLIQGQDFDYAMTEVARGANVGWSAFTVIWKKLLEKGIILPTRTIGNAKLFKLNKNNLFVKKLIQLDKELTKAETDRLLGEKVKIA
jgi:predicted transcriptional regulator